METKKPQAPLTKDQPLKDAMVAEKNDNFVDVTVANPFGSYKKGDVIENMPRATYEALLDKKVKGGLAIEKLEEPKK